MLEPEEGLARVSARLDCPVGGLVQVVASLALEVVELVVDLAIREPEAGLASLDFVEERVGVLGKLVGQSAEDSSCLVAELDLG